MNPVLKSDEPSSRHPKQLHSMAENVEAKFGYHRRTGMGQASKKLKKKRTTVLHVKPGTFSV